MARILDRSIQAQQHEHALKPQAPASVKHQAAAGFSPPMMSKAQVVYYLCRGGKMEPPHMIEVPHSPHDGLRLRDVKHRLTILRGSGMPNMFSWSCKRTYKNTHIWQDVCDGDSLFQVSGGEYILKGSEFIESSQAAVEKPVPKPDSAAASQIQRKFRGAETWLKVPSSAPLSPTENANASSQTQFPPEAAATAVSRQLKSLALVDHQPIPRSGPIEVLNLSGSSSDESTATKTHDIKVCEVRSHAQSVGTQTDENNNAPVYPVYKSSSPTPTSFAGSNSTDQSSKGLQTHLRSKSDVGAAAQGSSRLLKRKQKDSSGPKVKMKHGASCVFLHILSYCGGVDTRMQKRKHRQPSSSPTTEMASCSEYSFDGVCRVADHHQDTNTGLESSYHSMELQQQQQQCHHHHNRSDSYMGHENSPGMNHLSGPRVTHEMIPDDDNGGSRSGPLIPYSSEYFDVKEAVSPLQASSPLGATTTRSSKNISRCSSFSS